MNTGKPDPRALRARLVLFIAEYGYFISHRLALAQVAAADGYAVTVITRVPPGVTPGAWPGIEVVHVNVPRGLGSPGADLRALWQVTALLRRLRPGILHNVSVKVILLGTLAAWLADVPRVLNAWTGLGSLFHSDRGAVRVARRVLVPVLRRLVQRTGAWSLFQNPGDRAAMEALGLAAPERSALVPGVGVDVERFLPVPEPAGTPTVLFVGRLLRDKGLGEYVFAATNLAALGVDAQFLAAGEPDPANPHPVSATQLAAWRQSSPVQWLGQVTDMPALLARCHIVCLPSYHEGLPKVLLEAAACGRAVVASDIDGCRAVVEPGRTGLLVPPRDAAALAEALARLIGDPVLRREMGANGRAAAETRFTAAQLSRQVMELYRHMVNS